uniref:Uncharacterized protein n=1 Tax=Rhizophora mucronata TaxID=61149 RepID=A0A2P2N8M6_RHIMU
MKLAHQTIIGHTVGFYSENEIRTFVPILI